MCGRREWVGGRVHEMGRRFEVRQVVLGHGELFERIAHEEDPLRIRRPLRPSLALQTRRREVTHPPELARATIDERVESGP